MPAIRKASFLVFLLFGGLVITAPAAAQQKVDIPIGTLTAVEEDGQILFVSSDGRYAFRGEMISIFYRKPLSTLREINDAVNKLDFQSAGIDPYALSGFTIGDPSRQPVVMFIDPLCKPCHQAIHDAEALSDRYTFHFVVIPALGDESNALAKTFACAENKQKAFKELVDWKLKPADTVGCATDDYDSTLLLSQVSGIEGVPTIVSAKGHVFKGRHENLESWLERTK